MGFACPALGAAQVGMWASGQHPVAELGRSDEAPVPPSTPCRLPVQVRSARSLHRSLGLSAQPAAPVYPVCASGLTDGQMSTRVGADLWVGGWQEGVWTPEDGGSPGVAGVGATVWEGGGP